VTSFVGGRVLRALVVYRPALVRTYRAELYGTGR